VVNTGTREADQSPAVVAGFHDLVTSFTSGFSSLQKELQREREERRRINQAIYTIPDIPIGLINASSGAGSTLKLPDISGPKTGQIWFVTRFTANGMTAGSVDMNYLDVNGTQIDTIFFAAARTQSNFYGSTQIPVRPGNWLVFSAGSGFTGSAQISIGVTSVAAEYEGLYLL
jgi:hypothetical protein